MRRAVLAPLLAALLVLTLAATSVSAAPIAQRSWHASMGSGGAYGRELLTAFNDGTGQISLQLKGVRANSSYVAQVISGTCSRLGTLITSWTGIRTDATGAASTNRRISQATMNRIWYYARPGSIAIRFAYGRSLICANWGYYHATRVRIPNYAIDLPVVAGPSGYPYCNVAMYQKILWQPSEPGVTFIYAHARKGMFLPLLNASKVNNGAAMIGKLVYVYTDNSKMYTYKIVQVRRHVTSIQSAVGVTSEQLWLQTSEGPNFTYPKLIVVAKRIAVAPASYAASHPTPRIVRCS